MKKIILALSALCAFACSTQTETAERTFQLTSAKFIESDGSYQVTDTDDSTWTDAKFEESEDQGFSWYRFHFTIPENWKKSGEYDQIVFDFGTISGADEAYLNGKPIGRTGFFPENGVIEEFNSVPWKERHYYVSLADLKEDNVLAVKTFSKGLKNPVNVGLVHRTHDEALMTPALRYTKMMRALEKGWNTWDTRSVFTQLYLPETFAVKLTLMDGSQIADDIRIGNTRHDAAVVHPFNHTYDGYYTECDATWHGISVKLRTAASGDDLVMLVTPNEDNATGKRLRITPGNAWPHLCGIAEGTERFPLRDSCFMMYRTDWSVALKGHISAKDLKLEDGFYSCSLDTPVVISVGTEYSAEDADRLLKARKEEIETTEREKYGSGYDSYHAMQTILAWDTVYEPDEEVVISPVTRNWNVRWSTVKDFGGYVLFDWDTYFASQMLSVSCRELAYANAVEVTSRADKLGFVPKDHSDHNSMTEDCSQPPVGSMNIWKIYERYHEKWFLELVYDRLLAWNRWWPEARQTDGLLCWGSNQVRIRAGERNSGSRNSSVLESGLDNSHMYDSVRYDPVTCQLNMQDVGLTSMYVMDCDYLAKIAKELGKKEVREISERGDCFRKNIQRFWCEEDGMFYNIYTDTKQFCKRIGLPNFYVLLAKAATEKQAERIVREHLANENEFWGEWVAPNTPRNDPAFNSQDYWRGRIWGPTNYLVYEGLRNYDIKEIRKEYADKSNKLLMKDWLVHGYIYENWNAITGEGNDKTNSDSFYHWGALLGYIYLLENGCI